MSFLVIKMDTVQMSDLKNLNSMEVKIKKLEMQLSDALNKKHHYQNLFEKSPTMIYVTDRLGHFITINQAGVKLMGYDSEEEIIGKRIQDIFFKDHHDFQKFEILMMEQGTVRKFQTQIKHKKGDLLDVILTGFIRAKITGKSEGYEGYVTEITEQKQTEKKLQIKSDLLTTLMDNIPDTIYFKDQESRFTMINKAQAKLFGLNNAYEALGNTDFHYFNKTHAQDAYEDEQKILASGIPVVDKVEKYKEANGDFRWLSSTKVPIYNKEGVANGIVGISRDITEHKRAENAYR